MYGCSSSRFLHIFTFNTFNGVSMEVDIHFSANRGRPRCLFLPGFESRAVLINLFFSWLLKCRDPSLFSSFYKLSYVWIPHFFSNCFVTLIIWTLYILVFRLIQNAEMPRDAGTARTSGWKAQTSEIQENKAYLAG